MFTLRTGAHKIQVLSEHIKHTFTSQSSISLIANLLTNIWNDMLHFSSLEQTWCVSTEDKLPIIELLSENSTLQISKSIIRNFMFADIVDQEHERKINGLRHGYEWRIRFDGLELRFG